MDTDPTFLLFSVPIAGLYYTCIMCEPGHSPDTCCTSLLSIVAIPGSTSVFPSADTTHVWVNIFRLPLAYSHYPICVWTIPADTNMTLCLNMTPANTPPTLILKLYIKAAHAVFMVSVYLGWAHSYILIPPSRHGPTSAGRCWLALPLHSLVTRLSMKL